MPKQKSTLSVRITPQDAEFIAKLKIDNAITPSDKIRALLREAREKRERESDLSTYLGFVRRAINPLFDHLKEEELEKEVHSELISTFGEWLVKLLGYLASVEEKKKHDLPAIEEEIATRIFRLFDYVARLGITAEAPCYHPALITEKLPPLMEIMEIVKERRSAHENERSQTSRPPH